MRSLQYGDIVRVKTWDQLEQEFGLDSEGNINCKMSFLPIMAEYFSGKEARYQGLNLISQIIGTDICNLRFENEVLNTSPAKFTPEMIEFVRAKDAPAFSVGDTVKVKSFEQMEKEYGLNNDYTGMLDLVLGDSICVPYGFPRDFGYICGQTATVTEIRNNGEILLKDWSCDTPDKGFRFHETMFEKKSKLQIFDIERKSEK